MAGGIALSVGLSVLSYFYVEQRLRKRRILASPNRLLMAFLAGSVVIGLTGAVIRISDGLPSRIPKSVAEYKTKLAEQNFRFREASEVERCWLRNDSDMDTLTQKCMASEEGRKNVIVMGDSHSAHLMAGLRSAFPETHFSQVSGSSCPLVRGYSAGVRKACRAILDWMEDTNNFCPFHAVVLSTRGERDSARLLGQWAIELSEIYDGEVHVVGPASLLCSEHADHLSRDNGQVRRRHRCRFR
ncbi:SGNH hydrolase domain-containing protein [uncultured Algimonas sp.]|uniref:SGNH hydrolase domain-containing protein n=1 Tax=uncultured Algimonas sp. TaxID=1547920 RepID=UPI0026255FEA|nr:SGNH hydrolase domain-containing protein [uncultured Algimonas sp.]